MAALCEVTLPNDFCAALKIRFIPNRAFLWGCCSIAAFIIYFCGSEVCEDGENVCVCDRETQRPGPRVGAAQGGALAPVTGLRGGLS